MVDLNKPPTAYIAPRNAPDQAASVGAPLSWEDSPLMYLYYFLSTTTMSSLSYLCSILNITEAVGDRMLGFEGSSTLVAPAMAISVVDVIPGLLGNLTFGVSSAQDGLNPEVSTSLQCDLYWIICIHYGCTDIGR